MEKFGLLNLLKAIETLSPPPRTDETNTRATAPAPEPQQPAREQLGEINVMAQVLSRHEQISNRVRNSSRK
ncbi:MAG: hypothetical protein K2K80_02785 [Clostridia bacterium]|nr:hypothetical protein [Clostridia bacterium]